MQLKEFGVSLGDLIHEFNFEVVYGPEGFEKIEITKDDVNRPGLQLAGFFDYFDPNRIQVMGKVESSYVEQMESEERRACFDRLFETRIPVLLITRPSFVCRMSMISVSLQAIIISILAAKYPLQKESCP